MKNSRANVNARRIEILNRLREDSALQVEELARQFGVSTMSMRRDLQYLEDNGLIRRFRGGACALSPGELPCREDVTGCRDRISRYAARFVEDGDTLFINGSMTALNMLRYVQADRVHVITNNGHAVGQDFDQRVNITLTGGELRGHIMAGEYVMRNLLAYQANKAFIGCAGISGNGALSYNIPTEIGINEAMIARTAKEVYVLADHTKLELAGDSIRHYGSCLYERPWTLITDDAADPDVIRSLRQEGKTVHIVPGK